MTVSRNRTFGDRVRARFGAPPKISLSEAQLGWLAGFFDGEGTIAINRYPTVSKKPSFHGSVTVANTDKRVIAYIKELLSAHVSCITPSKPRKKNHKVCYHIQLRRRSIAPFLEVILPYLVGKKKQAQLVLAFYRALDSTLVTQPHHEIFERLYMECKALNKRGA
jgi:hypothetical protein